MAWRASQPRRAADNGGPDQNEEQNMLKQFFTGKAGSGIGNRKSETGIEDRGRVIGDR